MRKFYNYLAMALLLAMTATALTGCTDDDVDMAYDMNGIWEGIIQGNYYHDRYGNNDYVTYIMFEQDGDFSRGGYGEERDYPSWGGRPVYSRFSWEVRNGKILIEYEDGYRVVIRDYDLYSARSGMHFRGYFDDYRTGEQLAWFDLDKTSEWPDFYWAKEHESDFGGQADSIAAEPAGK